MTMNNVIVFVFVFVLVIGIVMNLSIPCSRSGKFYPILLGLIHSESKERVKSFNLLYIKSLTTENIGCNSRNKERCLCRFSPNFTSILCCSR